MPDALSALLQAEADRLVADEQVPPVEALRARGRRPRARTWAPALAAASVVGVVLAVQAVHAPAPARPAVRPVPTAVETVVPPEVVRTRLGAPSGHVNGPAVPSADLLAASAAQDGLVLRTVAAVRPSLRVDPQGAQLVDRCRYTYTEPAAAFLQGRCDWGVDLERVRREARETGVTAEQRRALGRPYLAGRLPAGTAGVLLRSPGRDPQVVGVADPGPEWDGRPSYVAWWPRVATDVVALAADGRELGRVRLPSEVPVRGGPGDPELGTVELPLSVRAALAQQRDLSGLSGLLGSTPRPAPTPVSDRADLLLRVELAPDVVLSQYGVRTTDGERCTAQEVLRLDGDPPYANLDCRPPLPADVPDPRPPIEVGRSFEAGDGAPGEQLLTGTAPPGTVRVRLRAAGTPTRTVAAFDGGPRWDGRASFAADWPSRGHTTVTAFDADGDVLAVTRSRGLDPHAFDEDVLRQVAGCLRAQGVRVTELPQPAGGPAYTYDYGALGPARGQRLTEQCEDAATGQR